jgi:hypothetical protein
VQCFHAEETVACLWLKHNRNEKVRDRLITIYTGISLFLNVGPKALPLVFSIPDVCTLVERDTILSAILKDLPDGNCLGFHQVPPEKCHAC